MKSSSMQTTTKYDCAIVGGGVAGLCLAIQLAELEHTVILFEKNTYPFHKVCGEYISNESRNFLERLGISLSTMNLPSIDKLGISSPKGYMLEAPLLSGGFGISRYKLDAMLSDLAKEKGVVIMENCKVHSVDGKEGLYTVTTASGLFEAKVVCGSYGKRTPVFIDKVPNTSIPNYIGVKYHIKTSLSSDRIELHNFKDGYCGISKIEDDRYCLCYLTTADNLKENDNDIRKMESAILMLNPHLKRYFQDSEFLFDKPLVISQVTFNKKHTDSNGLFLLGDAAGAIAPLCGNGMSIGMRSSVIATNIISSYIDLKISKKDALLIYKKEWNKNFAIRIKAGFYLQQILGKNNLTDISLKVLSHSPKLVQKIIKLTHGQPF